MGVCQPVVVVEDHDGGDAAGGDHEHDAGEVGTFKYQAFMIPCASLLAKCLLVC